MFPATEWHGEGRDCEHVVCFPTVNGAQCAGCRMTFRRALPRTPVKPATITLPSSVFERLSANLRANIKRYAHLLGASHA